MTTSLALPSLPDDDVIPPSRIQVLVDQSGRIVSAILLPSTDSTEAIQRCDAADQRALGIAKQLRFNPARQLDLGEILFSWHTVPMHSNNSLIRAIKLKLLYENQNPKRFSSLMLAVPHVKIHATHSGQTIKIPSGPNMTARQMVASRAKSHRRLEL